MARTAMLGLGVNQSCKGDFYLASNAISLQEEGPVLGEKRALEVLLPSPRCNFPYRIVAPGSALGI